MYKLYDRIISPNIWDELWEVGGINNNGFNNNETDRIRSKNYIYVVPNKSIYFFIPNPYYMKFFYYDANKNYIGNSGGFNISRVETIPANCHYVRFSTSASYGTTYNHDICINESNPSINGTYYPYVMYKKYKIADTNGISVPEGYQSVDIKLSDNYGYVDLGSLNWEYVSAYGFFRTTSGVAEMIHANVGNAAKMICSKYNTVNNAYDTDSSLANGSISQDSSYSLVKIKDTSAGTNATLFKSAMSGIYLIYELATPSNPTIVKANDKNKYCYHNSVLGIYDSESETFRYNSNIEMSAYIKKYKIGDEEYVG